MHVVTLSQYFCVMPAKCNRCKKWGHWQQDCYVGRIRLDEIFDAQGLKDAQRDLAGLQPKNAKEAERKKWIGLFIDKLDKAIGPLDAKGLRWLRNVSYMQRCDSKGKPSGRHQAKSPKGISGPAYGNGLVSQVHLQGMLRELRGYALGPSAQSCTEYWKRKHGHAHDLDFKCCQPSILSQLPAQLTWEDGRAPPVLRELRALAETRDELFKELAEYHSLELDSKHYDGYQKDLLKKLTTSLCFGGSPEGWVKSVCMESQCWMRQKEPHPRIKALQEELDQLRVAIFESVKWAPFVAEWREVLKEEKNGDSKAIDRSIMARIAQDCEAKAMLAMKTQLEEDGWKLIALIFDGVIVLHREGVVIDLNSLQDRVLRDTGFEMIIEEKPLFDAAPKLTLDRAFGCDVGALPVGGIGLTSKANGSTSSAFTKKRAPTKNASNGLCENKKPKVDDKGKNGGLRRTKFEATEAECEEEERKSSRAAKRDLKGQKIEDLGSEDCAVSEDNDDDSSDDSGFITEDDTSDVDDSDSDDSDDDNKDNDNNNDDDDAADSDDDDDDKNDSNDD